MTESLRADAVHIKLWFNGSLCECLMVTARMSKVSKAIYKLSLVLANYTRSKQNAERNMERHMERFIERHLRTLLGDPFPQLYNKPTTQHEEVAMEESNTLLRMEIDHLKRVQGGKSEYD